MVKGVFLCRLDRKDRLSKKHVAPFADSAVQVKGGGRVCGRFSLPMQGRTSLGFIPAAMDIMLLHFFLVPSISTLSVLIDLWPIWLPVILKNVHFN